MYLWYQVFCSVSVPAEQNGQEEPLLDQLRRRKWNWLGHVEKKWRQHCQTSDITTARLRKNSATRQRDLEKKCWLTTGFIDAARRRWRQQVICGLCSTGTSKSKTRLNRLLELIEFWQSIILSKFPRFLWSTVCWLWAYIVVVAVAVVVVVVVVFVCLCVVMCLRLMTYSARTVRYCLWWIFMNYLWIIN